MSRSTPFPRTHKIKYEIVKASRDTGNSPLGHRRTALLKSPSIACNVQNFKIMDPAKMLSKRAGSSVVECLRRPCSVSYNENPVVM